MESSMILKMIPLISLILYIILFLILLGSKKNKITQYYSFYIVTMIVWNMGSFFMRIDLYPSASFWNKVLCSGVVTMPAVFYHFTIKLTGTKYRERIVALGYITAGLFIIHNSLWEGIITNVRMINGEMQYDIGPLAGGVAAASFLFLMLSLGNIISRVKEGAIELSKVRFIIVGIILVLIAGVLNLDTELGKYPIDILSNVINALLIAYSIYRYRFLELKFIMKRGITYSLYKICITGVYIFTILLVEHIASVFVGYSSFAGTVILGVTLAFMFQPIKNYIQKFIDNVFYKDRKMHKNRIREFSNVIKNEAGIQEISSAFLLCVEKGLKVEGSILFIKNENGDFSGIKHHNCEGDIRERKYSNGNTLIRWFSEKNNIITSEEIFSNPIFKGLWSDEKEELKTAEINWIVPIKLRNELLGILMLREKKSKFPISEEEEEFLNTILNNAAIAIDNAQMYENLKKQAITDGLTKLYNHRYIHDYIEECMDSDRCGTFSIAMIDVDFFKLYNDLYGHSNGDKALEKIARILKESTRELDVVSRYGGEEFAIVFPGLSGEEAFIQGENIRRNIETSMGNLGEVSEFLTVSIGVANYPENGNKYKDVLDKADEAMYTAKKRGKNICVSCSEIMECSTKEDENELSIQNGIRDGYFSAMHALAATIDAKDHYTYGHSENVANYAVLLGEEIGMDKERQKILRQAGMLHDIGKIGIPESILTKEAALTDEEFDIMKKHVEISITIIKHIPNLIKVIPAIMSHHEKYNGSGYPRRIKGESIPLEGRILCIVDSFDAMTTDRTYRRALSDKEAIEELERNKGSQFDPDLTDAFIRLYRKGKIKTQNSTKK